MPKTQFETLLFDLDGTISDPFVGISRSINYALEALNFKTVDPERVRPMIGPPLTEIFEHFLGVLTDDVMQALIDKYRERYTDEGYKENAIYPDIPGVVAELAAGGYTMGICTSKRADYATSIVEMFGLGDHFSFVNGGGIGVKKHQQIQGLVRNGLDPRSAIMIGDRKIDITAGKINSLASAGVLWGFGDRPELEQAAPDHLLESPSELLDLFVPGNNQ